MASVSELRIEQESDRKKACVVCERDGRSQLFGLKRTSRNNLFATRLHSICVKKTRRSPSTNGPWAHRFDLNGVFRLVLLMQVIQIRLLVDEKVYPICIINVINVIWWIRKGQAVNRVSSEICLVTQTSSRENKRGERKRERANSWSLLIERL